MRNHGQLITAVFALAGLALLAGGCEREIAHTERTEIKDDGTVRTQEKTVTEGPGDRTTVTETKTVDKPDDPD
jgi:hypothetical protein